MARTPFLAFMEATDAVTDPCETCGCWGLRRYTANDGTLKTVCVNRTCPDSPFHPDQTQIPPPAGTPAP